MSEITADDLVMETGFDDETIKTSGDVAFYRGEAGRIDRIGIVSKKVKMVKTHYKKGVGHVLCRSRPAKKKDGQIVSEAYKALCCEKLTGKSSAKLRCGVVIVQYSTDRKGEILKPFDYTLKVWIFGEDKYVRIRNYNKALPIAENDIMIDCSDATFQKLSFDPATGSMWQKDQLGWKDEIIEEAAQLEEKLPRFMGKVLTDDEIREAVGGSAAAAGANLTGTEQDLDAVLGNM